MKRRIVSIAVALGLLVGLTVFPAQAATEDEIEQSITDGCAYLAWAQNPDGSWGKQDQVAKTGLAVIKLEERAFEEFESPFDEDYVYSSNVIAGLDYIFSQAGLSACCTNPDPANPTMICFVPGWTETYSTGIAMMAIAAGKDPARVVAVPGSIVNGWTYKQVMDACVAYFACAQNPDGGWRYQCFDPISDNSNTGYAVLGLSYAKVFGCAIPPALITSLSAWIDFIQCNPGDPGHTAANDGGSGYDSCCGWVNLLKTGNLLAEMALVGDAANAPRVQRAIAYIERHWDDMNYDPGWRGDRGTDNDGDGFIDEDPPDLQIDNDLDGLYNEDPVDGVDNDIDGLVDEDPVDVVDDDGDGLFNEDMGLPHYQAMYCLMKGLAAYGVDTLTVTRGGIPVDVKWFDEVADAIVKTQMSGGYWYWDWWGNHLLATPWALLTLEVVIPDVTPPMVWVEEAVNPHGKNVPPAGSSTMPGPKGGINDDGFYQLFAEDNRDPYPYMIICYFDPEAPAPEGEPSTTGWWVPVTDKAGDVFWCLSGTVIKLTEAPGAPPSVKKMGSTKGKASAVDYHITVPSSPPSPNNPYGVAVLVVAYDASGNSSWVVAWVPPPLK